MKRKIQSVDEYLAALPEPSREILERVRRSIRRAVPRAEEGISYGMPVYQLDGEGVLWVAAWKKHFSLYPASRAILEACEGDLAPYEIDKGTIRFPLSAPVPVTLIARIAKLRAREVRERRRGAAAR
jgi:uncharacterized protein YdhG (YjbR/CyaY superfamily)